MALKEKIINPPFEGNEQKRKIEKEFSDTDLRFMSSLTAAVVQKSTKSSRIIIWTVFFLAVSFIVWASFTTLDEMTRGEGKVIPSQQVQKVQYLEGGIVSEILIQEGEVVKKDQPLIRLEDLGFSTKFRENRIRLYELKAKGARLKAQFDGKEIDFDKTLKEEFPQIVRDELSLFESSMAQLEQKQSILNEKLKQREQQITEAINRKDELQSRYKLIEKEIELTEPLVKRSLLPEVEFLKLKRQASEIKGNLDAITLSIPRVRSEINEAQKTIQETKLGFINRSKQEYNECISEIARIEEMQQLVKDKVSRTILRSPVDGTIKQLFVNTVGGVVHPGRELIEIVPLEDKLLAEVKIKPADIAYLNPGQEAMVKFSAYDFSIYGGLKGRVVNISPDTITSERGESYYLVRIKTDESHLGSEEKPLKIMAGMTVSVDILTGKKTILDYILKPILKAKHTALRER